MPEHMSAWIQRFAQWMQVNNYSESSVLSCRHVLTAFSHWCEVRGIANPQEVTLTTLEHYQRWLFFYRKADGESLKITTQRVRLVHVSSVSLLN